MCWGKYNPSWLTKLNATSKKVALVNHIKNVVSYYGDAAYGWDVVNEAVTDDKTASDDLKDSDWYPDVPDYIDVAFMTARSANKNVKVILLFFKGRERLNMLPVSEQRSLFQHAGIMLLTNMIEIAFLQRLQHLFGVWVASNQK